MTNKDLLHSTGKSTRYSVIAYMGKCIIKLKTVDLDIASISPIN